MVRLQGSLSGKELRRLVKMQSVEKLKLIEAMSDLRDRVQGPDPFRQLDVVQLLEVLVRGFHRLLSHRDEWFA
ncbi:unnamed protein product [Sphagnum balticum]